MYRALLLALVSLALGACASSIEAEPRAAARRPQSICLVGRFTAPLSRPDLAHRLEELGFEVRPYPSEGLAIALVGTNPVNAAGDGFIAVEETDAYREAVQQGATIIRLKDLSSLFARPLADGLQRNAHK